jgi:hypothetical protein
MWREAAGKLFGIGGGQEIPGNLPEVIDNPMAT